MNALRQYHKIDKSREIKISIPADFNATEVEVIVLPTKSDYEVPEDIQKMVLERKAAYLANPDDVQDMDEMLNELRDELGL